MAAINPYTIHEDENRVTGGFETWTLDKVNDQLPDNVELIRLHECDCGNRSYGATVERGDKWHLRYCSNCAGLYGWHDVRADYL